MVSLVAKKESAMERQLKEEERILESVAESKALMGVAELAKGIQYEDPIKTRYYLSLPSELTFPISALRESTLSHSVMHPSLSIITYRRIVAILLIILRVLSQWLTWCILVLIDL